MLHACIAITAFDKLLVLLVPKNLFSIKYIYTHALHDTIPAIRSLLGRVERYYYMQLLSLRFFIERSAGINLELSACTFITLRCVLALFHTARYQHIYI